LAGERRLTRAVKKYFKKSTYLQSTPAPPAEPVLKAMRKLLIINTLFPM
jgi:hypothetical protein